MGIPSNWLLCSFDRCHCSSGIYSQSDIRYSGLILNFPQLSPEISHFTKVLWFPFMEKSIQKSATKYAHCYWCVIASSSSQHTEQGNMCMCGYIHHIHTIYLSIYSMSPKTSNSNPITQNTFLIFLLYICIFLLLTVRNGWLPLSSTYWFICSVLEHTESSFRTAKPQHCESINLLARIKYFC